MARAALGALAVVVATAAGCGSSKPPPVQLKGGTDAAGGKAIVLSTSTDKKLASFQAIALRGISADPDGASFDKAGYVDNQRCVATACEWTVVPAKAGTYEYKAFLVDLRDNKAAGASDAVKVDWAAPARPKAIKLFVNGKTPPRTPLEDDEYHDFPAGPMQVVAKWTTDARDTGYYVKISNADEGRVYARCSTGTSCQVPVTVPLGANEELSWQVELLTTQGNKVASGFKVCLEGEA
jgi:hypothetical protein